MTVSLVKTNGKLHLRRLAPEGARFLHYQDRNFTLTEDATRIVVLRSGFIVSGYVFAPDGSTPFPRCCVSLNNLDTKEVFGSWTDVNGYYSFLAPSVGSDTYLNLKLGAT